MDNSATINVHSMTQDILGTIDREREREIVSRRFGLYDRKETLEQIGELLGITRERVRQLEKSIVIKLKETALKDLVHIQELEKHFIKNLHEVGRVSTVKNFTTKLGLDASKQNEAHVAFISTLVPSIEVVDENDHYKHAIGIAEHHNASEIKQHVDVVHNKIKEIAEPANITQLHQNLDNYNHPDHIEAFASVSKHLASLRSQWGLIKWPTVNPKNIRDKIYVILQDSSKPLHFSDIAKEIHGSAFKRKDVTTQAIHNELIKDKRFVLIGRGIYALKEWGYKKGTVADVIETILTEAGEPLHRDEIVKRVLAKRQVKETTILLNLQGKEQFKRTAKATYSFTPAEK